MISKEEALKKMIEYKDKWDHECGHIKADDLLIQIIREHLPEFEEVITTFKKMKKWYA